jgi:hypothetical protein
LIYFYINYNFIFLLGYCTIIKDVFIIFSFWMGGFNTTFNNISVISWQSVLLVEETRVYSFWYYVAYCSDAMCILYVLSVIWIYFFWFWHVILTLSINWLLIVKIICQCDTVQFNEGVGRDHMVVGFTTFCALSVYHH